MTVDLHLHTTASDGRCTPAELVEQAAQAGVSVMAVTDHDTTAALAEVRAVAALRGVATISGIEITAVDNGRDVHVLGYFFDETDAALEAFLLAQRTARIARVEAIAARLDRLGLPVDIQAQVADARAHTGRSIGRPQVARAMVDAGHVADIREAFDSWLACDRPGFVPRDGALPGVVIEAIHRAGGLASLAHPGKTNIDDGIPRLTAAGLDALEAFHPDHDDIAVMRYVDLSRRFGLRLSGGSDFHGDPAQGRTPGSVLLPAEEWERLSDGRI